jgi:hypothetical protein
MRCSDRLGGLAHQHHGHVHGELDGVLDLALACRVSRAAAMISSAAGSASLVLLGAALTISSA